MQRNKSSLQNGMRLPLYSYILGMLDQIASRSTCLRRGVGAIITKEGCIVSTGYNGAPSGCVHCYEIGCIRNQKDIPSGQNVELCRGSHAEINAIVQAAKNGISLRDTEIWVNLFPCSMCTKALINAGIVRINYIEDYVDTLGRQLAKEAGVGIVKYCDSGNNDNRYRLDTSNM